MIHNNNIQQGYKQTELGIIPEDWAVRQLGDCVNVYDGTHQTPNYVPVGIPFYSVENVTANNFSHTKHISPNEHKILTSRYKIQKGDILMTRIGSIGVCKYVDWDVDASFYVSLALLKPYNIDALYLSMASNATYFKDSILLNSLQFAIPQKINLGNISNVKILVPPIAEQRAIAEALSDVDGLIAALDKKIAKKRLLKQGAMQQLLTGKKRLHGFTDEWVEKPIRLLCKLYGRIGFRGYTKADLVHKGEGAITFSPSDIHEQVISYTNCDYISWRKYDESPEIQVFNGDIIFCKTASIGKCAIIKNLPEKATINPQFVVLKDFKCNNEWLYYSIIDRKFQTVVSGITGGSTIPTMSQEKLYEQTLLCPPTIEEQQAIATILSDMDKEIADLEAQRDKYRLLKSGMMQKLLTGQIRLKTE